MTGHKLTFRPPATEACDCARRIGGCRWFKCGQPGPQEHAYKCEVFYATAGNFVDQPGRLRNISLIIAHVLGYTEGPPHIFGMCGKLWTLAALQYRLRDGALSSSMAVLLTPRPAPLSLVPFLQKLGRSEKPYNPRSHRFFDTNPFNGLGVGRHGVERKMTLSHVASAVWSEHAAWLARASMGEVVSWDKWQLDHIAPPPRKLFAEDGYPPVAKKMLNRKKRFSTSVLKDRKVDFDSKTPYTSEDSGITSTTTPRLETPPFLRARPRSFAGFADWEVPNTPTNRFAAPDIKAAHRMSCSVLDGPTPKKTPRRALPHVPSFGASNRILVLQNGNDSTYYLANDSILPEDVELARHTHFGPSPIRH